MTTTPTLRTDPLDPEQVEQAARVFKALADPIRLQLLARIVSCAGQPCVLDISEGLPVSAPTVSYHLRVLREAGLIACVRRGTSIHYQADLQALRHFGALLICC